MAVKRAVAMLVAAAFIGAHMSRSTAATLTHVVKTHAASVQNADETSGARKTSRSSNRAAIGAFLGIAGTVAAIAAAERYRRHYGYGYYPHDGPYPYSYRPYRYCGYPSYPAPRYNYPGYRY